MSMLVLSKEHVRQLIDLDCVLEAVEGVYTAKAKGNTVVWPTVFHEWEPSFHDMDIKSGYLCSENIHGIKTLTYNAANEKLGLPTLMGIIAVFDSITGAPLGVLDADFITGLRTGCAGAVGAKYLARKNPQTLFVLGTGNQAIFQVGAFLKVFPGLKQVYLCNPRSRERAEAFASALKARLDSELHIDSGSTVFTPVHSREEMAACVGKSDMIVTVTPSRQPLIRKEWIRPGTHFSCIGADMPGKEEIDPELFRGAVIFTDDPEHAKQSGEMELPLKNGVITEAELSGEIGDLILGRCPGRTDDSQITIYDACGMALLDIAAAKSVLDLAQQRQLGQCVEL